MKSIYVDMDGTLFDVEHRRHFLQQTPPRWDLFHDHIQFDTVFEHTKAVVLALKAAGYAIIIGTARTGTPKWTAMTTAQLTENDIPWDDLYIRNENDQRPDEIVKVEMLEQMRADGWDIQFALDDRQKVVDAFRAVGLPVMQVNPGDFDNKGAKAWDVVDPEGPLLTLLVGPVASGKSTLVSGVEYKHAEVISSDALREQITGDFQCQTENDRVFSYMRDVVRTRARHGLPTIVDATNIRAADRKAFIKCLPADSKVAYVIVERSLEDRLKYRGWRSEELVRSFDQRWKSSKKHAYNGDGFDNVTVHVVNV